MHYSVALLPCFILCHEEFSMSIYSGLALHSMDILVPVYKENSIVFNN